MELINGLASVGIPGLLASICVLMTIQTLGKVATFLWDMKQKKDAVSESTLQANTKAVQELNERLKSVEDKMFNFDKMENDMKRMFSAVKLVAGEKWAQIRKEIMEEFPH